MNPRERVARAIAQAFGAQKWERLTPLQRLEYFAASVSAIAAMQADGVKVKPLVWMDCGIEPSAAQGTWRVARCIIGLYEIHTFDMKGHEGVAFLHVPNGGRMKEFLSVVAAEKAAQADYERRILDALA